MTDELFTTDPTAPTPLQKARARLAKAEAEFVAQGGEDCGPMCKRHGLEGVLNESPATNKPTKKQTKKQTKE